MFELYRYVRRSRAARAHALGHARREGNLIVQILSEHLRVGLVLVERQVLQRLAERGFNVEKRLPAVGKDYNESLIWYKSKIEKQRGERV